MKNVLFNLLRKSQTVTKRNCDKMQWQQYAVALCPICILSGYPSEWYLCFIFFVFCHYCILSPLYFVTFAFMLFLHFVSISFCHFFILMVCVLSHLPFVCLLRRPQSVSHDIARYELVRIEVCLRKQLYRTIKAKNRAISHDIARFLAFIAR